MKIDSPIIKIGIYLLLTILGGMLPGVLADDPVGSRREGILVATGQRVNAAGKTISFAGRPIDLVLSTDRRTLYVKTSTGVLVIEVATWKIRQDLKYREGGGSMHGIAVARDGRHVYVTDADNSLLEILVGKQGKCSWGKKFVMARSDSGASYPCGVAVTGDGTRAYVALSRNNSVAVIDLALGTFEMEIPVGVAPFDVVLSADESIAYVSNWGGRKPSSGERFMNSAGTDVLVDERSIPSSGTVSQINLRTHSVTGEIPVGLHPSDIELGGNSKLLYVANANSDNISVIDTKTFLLASTIPTRLDSALPFGSITNALAVGPDEKTLYAANGGNNAIAVIPLPLSDNEKNRVQGFIPTGWFPSAVVTDGKYLYVANAKGEGSRQKQGTKAQWHVRWERGTLNKVPRPSQADLQHFTKQVSKDARVPQVLQAYEHAASGVAPRPVPARSGEPSVFEHVVYVLKENRTYDQLFGDLKKGNGDSSLCMYGRAITPNHHALADQFVLLDNYYCNGIVSADGHQWATQGITTDYQEKTFGSWTRSYDFGSDPLAFAPTNFIWENALLHGRSFRNYGEFDFPTIGPKEATWSDVYEEYKRSEGKITLRQSIPLEPLRQYTCPTYMGWELRIPDVMRLDAFMKEFAEYEKHGDWPNLIFVYLPQDHTSGQKKNMPTPRSHLADNDLALGKLVEAISKSRFWPTTCIFVNEDDPQDGFDHVDGHRSICLVVSPYTKRGEVISKFYNQGSVLHTIERILGLPPMNQLDALAPTMEDCFVVQPNLTPYAAVPATIPLDEINKRAELLGPEGLRDREKSDAFDLTRPDRNSDDLLNRILWHDAKGYKATYPAHFAGAHGRGLNKLKLKLDAGSIHHDD